MKVMVTGGTGYIGSHASVELLKAGHEVVLVDNLSNSHARMVEKIQAASGRNVIFHESDVRDEEVLARLMVEHGIEAVLHFAGLKCVGESLAQPHRYYSNNVAGSLAVSGAMKAAGVNTLVFSSSAAIYGQSANVPVKETSLPAPCTPYGKSKWMVEEMLNDMALENPGWRLAILRYFNPMGAHESGLLGEDSRHKAGNLMPSICEVASGERDKLMVYGGDYATPDGSCVRDYIHVVDLALGHVAALAKLADWKGTMTVNLGAGRGYSVFDVMRAFEKATGRPVPHQVSGRRQGDVAVSYADVSLAHAWMGWRATRDLEAMCRDYWRWYTTR